METNSDLDVARWVDDRLAALSPPCDWQADVARGLARLEGRRNAERVRTRRRAWGLVAAAAACLSLMALPAMWVGRTPAQIAGSLLDSVLSMLDLDFAHLHLISVDSDGPLEVTRLSNWTSSFASQAEFGSLFKPTIVLRTQGRPPPGPRKARGFCGPSSGLHPIEFAPDEPGRPEATLAP